MALISNRYNFIEDDEQNNEGYTLPAVVTKTEEGIDFKKSLTMSVVLHPLTVFMIWMFIFILSLLGINFLVFNKPDMSQKKDIEFVLVDQEAMPRNPKTKNRADINSRSGGINDPKKKVSMPSAPKQQKASASSASLQKMIQKQQKQIQKTQTQTIKQQTQQAQKAKAPSQQQSKVERPAVSKPAPPTVAPSTKPMMVPPNVTPTPTTPFAVPIPSGIPVGKSISTGPIGGTSAETGAKSGGATSGGSSSGKYAPAPSLAPSRSGGSSGQLARGGSGSGGNYGNPGGGGGRPGIDAIKEPDFGPYMRELQRRIKLNWNPPKGNESKRVVLLFKIAKSGRMLSCRVLKSSGLPAADQAALRAVELTAPFRPLPVEFKGQSIDIQFTFDYNVFGANRY